MYIDVTFANLNFARYTYIDDFVNNIIKLTKSVPTSLRQGGEYLLSISLGLCAAIIFFHFIWLMDT